MSPGCRVGRSPAGFHRNQRPLEPQGRTPAVLRPFASGHSASIADGHRMAYRALVVFVHSRPRHAMPRPPSEQYVPPPPPSVGSAAAVYLQQIVTGRECSVTERHRATLGDVPWKRGTHTTGDGEDEDENEEKTGASASSTGDVRALSTHLIYPCRHKDSRRPPFPGHLSNGHVRRNDDARHGRTRGACTVKQRTAKRRTATRPDAGSARSRAAGDCGLLERVGAPGVRRFVHDARRPSLEHATAETGVVPTPDRRLDREERPPGGMRSDSVGLGPLQMPEDTRRAPRAVDANERHLAIRRTQPCSHHGSTGAPNGGRSLSLAVPLRIHRGRPPSTRRLPTQGGNHSILP
ncbi:hypothetical protein C8Q77DRAFT_1073003 [Trametes polyzona]|nr:hypothetical protein C8Q77DRAFT_1073003 [Trametes polyzona]